MKKLIALALLLVFSATLLVSCNSGPLTKPANGTYKSDEGLLSQTWTFSGSNNVTLSAGGGLVSTTGTYTISGNKLSITASLLGVESTTGYTITEITSNSFFIDGTKFEKQ